MTGYDISEIRSGFIDRIIYLPACGSTNTVVKNEHSGEKEGLLVITDTQTCGRGRTGKSWSCGGEDSVAMSMLLRPEIKSEQVSMITLVAAAAAEEAFEKAAGIVTDIKWPNDILYKGKKICGILTEGIITGREVTAVLGIGINVNTESFPEELENIATSLFLAGGRKLSREKVISEFFDSFGRYYESLKQDGDLRAIADRYNERSISYDGIDILGRLRKRNEREEIILINSGEVT